MTAPTKHTPHTYVHHKAHTAHIRTPQSTHHTHTHSTKHIPHTYAHHKAHTTHHTPHTTYFSSTDLWMLFNPCNYFQIVKGIRNNDVRRHIDIFMMCIWNIISHHKNINVCFYIPVALLNSHAASCCTTKPPSHNILRTHLLPCVPRVNAYATCQCLRATCRCLRDVVNLMQRCRRLQ